MNLKNKVISFFALLSAFVASIFYSILMKKKADEAKDEAELLRKEKETAVKAINTSSAIKRENEEAIQNALRNNGDSGIVACEQLRKQLIERSRKRQKH